MIINLVSLLFLSISLMFRMNEYDILDDSVDQVINLLLDEARFQILSSISQVLASLRLVHIEYANAYKSEFGESGLLVIRQRAKGEII